jgi:putative oxidoreductase
MFPNLKASLAPFILRVGLAGIFLYHGFLKVSLHAGTNWSETLAPWLQVAVAWGEVLGGLLLLVGLLSRLATVWLTVTQIGAIVMITGERSFVHLRGIYGRPADAGSYRWEVGYEYNFALIAMCCTLLVLGSGRWSVDYLLFHRGKRTAPAPGLPAEPVGTVLPASPPQG